MGEPKAKPDKGATDKALVEKWGAASIQAGFTALPDVVFRHMKSLQLTHTDLLVLLHLASYWWKAKDLPWPSKARIAAGLNVDPSTVRRSIQRMEKLGYVQRVYRKAEAGDNQSNKYDLTGLVKAADKLSRQELETRDKRHAEDLARQTTPKTLELIQGGKAAST